MMFEDVLEALAQCQDVLAGTLVVTSDPGLLSWRAAAMLLSCTISPIVASMPPSTGQFNTSHAHGAMMA